jgi:tetratricopeptide (TPR) repeat protein
MAGVLGHVETLRRYGGETLAAAWSYAGLDVAERWGPRMGRPLALALGLGAAGIRYACTPRHRKGPTPVDALGTVLVFCSAMSTYFTATLESPPRHRALLGKMRVFDAFKRQILHGTYLACLNNGDVENGLFARALGRCGGCLELVHNDTRTPITPEERTAMLAMVHGQDAFVRILVHDPECESALQRLHDLGLLSVEFGADMYRALFHRMRGEEEEATRLFRQADAERLRAGDGWIWNSQATWVSALAYAGTRDVLGLRRTLERLEQYLEHGYGFEAVRTLTLGEYRRCRGELEGAREALESLIQDEQAPGFVRPHALAALAETYMVLRMGEAATYAAVQGSALASAPERGDLPARVRCQIVLGLMEQESGNGAGASARLDGIVEEAERQQSPALAAAAHEARARLAYAMEDPDRLSRHADAMGRWVRPTRNPALLQRLEQTLLLLGETAGEDALDEGGTVTAVGPASMDQSQVSASLRAARNGRERAEIALQVILQHTSASHGFLFKRHSNGLQLLAPEHGEEPPTELRETLAAMVQQDDERIAGNRPSGPVEVGGLHSIVLRHPDDGRCVAAAVVAPPPAGLKSSPPAEVLQELARGLLELGDPREPVFRSSVPPPP